MIDSCFACYDSVCTSTGRCTGAWFHAHCRISYKWRVLHQVEQFRLKKDESDDLSAGDFMGGRFQLGRWRLILAILSVGELHWSVAEKTYVFNVIYFQFCMIANYLFLLIKIISFKVH